MTTATEGPPKLETVRKLLAKAEDPGSTPEEAEALTAKAAELMARYGIEQAMIEAVGPQRHEKPADKRFPVDAPYARVKSDLLGWLAGSMRCRSVRIASGDTLTVHVFGYQSDIERLELLYTSLLLQMAQGLRRAEEFGTAFYGRQLMAWRRAWMLGFASEVSSRVRAAERQAERQAEPGTPGVALVLADRSGAVGRAVDDAYPRLRKGRPVSFSAPGAFMSGRAAGRDAHLGGTSVSGPAPSAIGR